MTTPEIQLPKVVQTRISRLAHASGRSPAAMLRFVLRDGFDAVELSINPDVVVIVIIVDCVSCCTLHQLGLAS